MTAAKKGARYQFVWWDKWSECGLYFYRWTGEWRKIYVWSLGLGWLEVRKWTVPL